MPRAADAEYLPVLNPARQVMAAYADMDELIRLGTTGPEPARKSTSSIRLHKPLEAFLAQCKEEATSLAEGYERLAQIMAVSETER